MHICLHTGEIFVYYINIALFVTLSLAVVVIFFLNFVSYEKYYCCPFFVFFSCY